MKKNIIVSLIILLGSCFLSPNLKAQEIIEIPPLFEYPVAPDEIEGFNEKCDYVVTHFWEPFDFKSQHAVNQAALNHAFNVYLTSLIYSTDKVFKESLDKLIKKLSGNPTMLVQFEKAAEESLYGPRADWVADDIYLRFLDAAAKNKKISNTKRDKYKARAELLRTSDVGQKAKSFKFTDRDGKEANYFPMSTPTILIFGDPTNSDWRIARLRMEGYTPLSQALEKGKLNIIYIALADDEETWKNAVANYSKRWNVGSAENIKEIYDIRIVPSFYLIGSDGNILMKNSPLNTTLSKALEIVGEG